MEITLIPSTRKYGLAAFEMQEVDADIKTAGQLIECIRDGYIPAISWTETESFLFEMACNAIEHDNRHTYAQCRDIISRITIHYFNNKDFLSSDAIMVFKNFLEIGILNFNI